MPDSRNLGADTSTILRPRADLPTRTTASYVLVAVEGPERGGRFALDGTQPARALIGTGPACEIRLTDPMVSRRHAAVDVSGHRLRLTDLESTNGTWVNGIAVVDAFLAGGEFVRLGETTFLVELLNPEMSVHVSRATAFGRVVGTSAEMRRLYPLCERLAEAEVPVIIEGETGTGKEVLAESLHEQGPRAGAPFIVFDCTAVPPNLLESALFGHEKGSFTGAVSHRSGVFEQAHGGTLFIDEIGDLDASMQPKLLRAIQRMEVQRVGAARWMRVDVRVLAATRRDLDREVQAGRFRDDLYYRLNVARIELPPLRKRQGDVEFLTQHFWTILGGNDRPIPHDLMQRFCDYAWPGNVRELYNAVARQLALGEFARFEPRRERAADAQPPSPTGANSSDFIDSVVCQTLNFPQARQCVVDEFERRYVERVLSAHGGSVVRAAAASGIARRYFQQIRARSNKPR